MERLEAISAGYLFIITLKVAMKKEMFEGHMSMNLHVSLNIYCFDLSFL